MFASTDSLTSYYSYGSKPLIPIQHLLKTSKYFARVKKDLERFFAPDTSGRGVKKYDGLQFIVDTIGERSRYSAICQKGENVSDFL